MTQQLSELEIKYHEITELYDLAEALVNTVEQAEDPDEQLRIVEPLIDQLGESADILCEEFIAIAGQQEKSPSHKGRVEGAIRKVYMAMDRYGRRAKRSAQKMGSTMRNLAEPIVEKIKRHVEHVIAIFIDFVDLSLDRMMQKQHMEELKRRQEKIAAMLHASEQQQRIAH